jgi:hypothetical protein
MLNSYSAIPALRQMTLESVRRLSSGYRTSG